MNKIKFILVFVLGVVAGGLILGFQGPAPSRAEGKLPTDLLYLHVSNRYNQTFWLRYGYWEKYKITGADKTADECITVSIAKKGD